MVTAEPERRTGAVGNGSENRLGEPSSNFFLLVDSTGEMIFAGEKKSQSLLHIAISCISSVFSVILCEGATIAWAVSK